MNLSAKKNLLNESDKSIKGFEKPSELMFEINLSKEKAENDVYIGERLELSESRSIHQNSNLNLNFINKIPFLEK